MIPTNLKVEFNESNLYLKVSWDDMGNSVQVYKVFRNKTVGSRPIFSGLGKSENNKRFFIDYDPPKKSGTILKYIISCKINNKWYPYSKPYTINVSYPGVELIEPPKLYNHTVEGTIVSQINCVGWYIYDLYDYPLPPRKNDIISNSCYCIKDDGMFPNKIYVKNVDTFNTENVEQDFFSLSYTKPTNNLQFNTDISGTYFKLKYAVLYSVPGINKKLRSREVMSDWTDYYTIYTKPNPPINFDIKKISYNDCYYTCCLKWDVEYLKQSKDNANPKQTFGYKITTALDNIEKVFEDNTLDVGEALYPIPIGLPYDIQNKVIIQTKNGDKYSEPSIINICIPNKPEKLNYTVTNYSTNYYNVSFSWNFKNKYEYVLTNVLSGKSYNVLKTTENGNYCFKLSTPLLYNHSYDFEVYALAKGTFKNMKSLKNLINVKVNLPEKFMPEAPILTSFGLNNSVTLRWNRIENINCYKIYRQVFSSNKMKSITENDLLCEVDKDTETYNDKEVLDDVRYIYYIKSINNYESKLSNYVIETL